MDIIEQSLDDRLSPLQSAFAGTNGVTELAFDHRVHRFALPTLTKQSIQACLRNPIVSFLVYHNSMFAIEQADVHFGLERRQQRSIVGVTYTLCGLVRLRKMVVQTMFPSRAILVVNRSLPDRRCKLGSDFNRSRVARRSL